MRIMLTNDDGIQAEGLLHLARAAAQFGRVTIVAPSSQCSAMSQRITIRQPMKLSPYEYPLPGVSAWQLDGTPADCVKIGLQYVMREQPDYVFSGINHGWNSGFDTCYSGTVGAALEARMEGVAAAAFSTEFPCDFAVTDAWLPRVLNTLLRDELKVNEIWNVNFPSCLPVACPGIKTGVIPAKHQVYADRVVAETNEKGELFLQETGDRNDASCFTEGTDVHALLQGYVTIGKLLCPVL